MPNRPIAHQISSQSVAKVRDVWASTGAAVEEVRQDYGEDLLVQTCLNGKMDASRIWVQVKGIASAKNMDASDNSMPIKARADLALRWARTADILLLVLWDVKGNRGWYTIPALSDLRLHSELVEKDRQEIELRVSTKNSFTVESAEVIAWEARIEHLSSFVRNLRGLEEEEKEYEPDTVKWVKDAILEALFDTMSDLGMIRLLSGPPSRRYALTEGYAECVLDQFNKSESLESVGAEEYYGKTVMRSVMKWVNDEAGCGISFTLLHEMLKVVMVVSGFSGLVREAGSA